MNNVPVTRVVVADSARARFFELASSERGLVELADLVDTQARLAERRGWRFRMISLAGNSFAADMGYFGSHGYEPGVSVFKKHRGEIVRVSDANLGPGDDFCCIWHLFDLLPEGAAGWQPLK